MKKLIVLLLTTIFIGCAATEDEIITQDYPRINTPEWIRGTWKDVESDRIIVITQNKIYSTEGGTPFEVTNADEDYSTNTTYGVSGENFYVTTLKTSEKLFFRYIEDDEVIFFAYFERI